MTPGPDQATTWRPRYDAAVARLGSKAEARWIAEEAASDPWPRLLDEVVSERAQQYFDQMVERRAAGEPLQYVLGRWGFRRLDLVVDRQVLIPRPETEQVVEVALGELGRLGPSPVVVDLGTGSGAIALSLAAEGRPGAVWATDRSPGAIAIARANLVGLGGSRATKVRLVEGSWWDALPETLTGQVSLVVSNPPYVTTAEMTSLPPVVAEWEPADALHAGPTGLEAIEVIVAGAPAWLARPGALVVELAPQQAAAAEALAHAAGFDETKVEKDLAGRDRALVARFRAGR
ncbi:MAG: peptide chain release factor N(5)-glutamine methyltransferase [Actinomycetota bacterium]|nr:peptide chain release factor N(5)-glutamine methyltransferase [Actinomycetota bacterium]